MKENVLRIENGKYYLENMNLESLTPYTKNDVMKTIYQQRYRIKKQLKDTSQKYIVKWLYENQFVIFYLKNGKLEEKEITIEID